MSKPKRRFVARRSDANQGQIVRVLRQLPGCTVRDTHALGKGFPDVIVGFRGVNILLEIKDGSKPPSERKLTQDEVDFFREWRGQVHVAESPQEALEIVIKHSVKVIG